MFVLVVAHVEIVLVVVAHVVVVIIGIILANNFLNYMHFQL